VTSVLFRRRSQRFRSAFGASVLSHAAFALLLYGPLTLPAPSRQLADQATTCWRRWWFAK